MLVIDVVGGKKEFRSLRGKRAALDGVDLSVPAGSVFGFLGPNGAGKTTTIRCLLGISKPTGGSWSVFGVALSSLAEVAPRVGCVLENPPFLPTLSGRKTLGLQAHFGGLASTRVDEVLDRVGLADRADDRIGSYSLGMRQRLSVAAALLKDPELLILDEPANGLDPAGIRDLRALLKTLGSEGRTIFVSSHLLSEVEAMCDHVAVIQRGRTLAQGTVKEIIGGKRPVGVVVKSSPKAKALSTLKAAGLTAVSYEAGTLLVTGADMKTVSTVLTGADLPILELRQEQRTLEDAFIELTEDTEL